MTGESVVARIHALRASLVDSERRVADVVLADPASVIRKTAAQLGREASTSATTVVRFAHSAGFPGISALAIALATVGSGEPLVSEESADGGSAREIVAAAARLRARVLDGVPAAVDPDTLASVAAGVTAADRVLCLGSALTMPVALDLAYRLAHLGIVAESPEDLQLQRIKARGLRPGDVCIAVMFGGKYQSVVASAEAARDAGATVIALTAFDRTPLTAAAEHVICVGGQAVSGLGVQASPARIAFMAVTDILVALIIASDRKKYERRLDEISELIETDLL